MPEQSKIIPNTFQTPNALVDDAVMAVLSGNETKCYLVVVRKTFGWHKQADRIAKSQIMQATGLGETAVDACMDALVEFGMVLRLAENNPNENHGVLWGLQTDDNLIAWDKLRERADQIAKKQAARIAKARAARGGGVDHQPQVDEQPQGGVDHQPPQKPLSKDLTTTTGDASQKTEPEPPAQPLTVPVVPVQDTPKPNIFKLFENNICLLTPFLADYLKDAEATYPETWIIYAIEEAVKNNKRNWNYIDAILKRIKTEGFGGNHDSKLSAQKSPSSRQGGKANHQPGSIPANAASAAAAERINARRRAKQPVT